MVLPRRGRKQRPINPTAVQHFQLRAGEPLIFLYVDEAVWLFTCNSALLEVSTMSIDSGITGIASSQQLSLFSQKENTSSAANSATPNFSDVFKQASDASGSVTDVNLNHATLGQVLVASQALGLGSVSGYLETMSTDTNGSSATANVLKNSTTYNVPALLENWANFDESKGATQGAEQIRAIEKTLVSQADANGNLSVDTATYNAIAVADAK